MDRNNPPVDDFSVNIFSLTPYTNNQPVVQVSEGDKVGATLLFSGIFLGLVGITFTVMGWIQRDGNSFEWTQLLGPILLSVGVTFALISVCKFKMLTCKSCKNSEDTALEAEQPPAGQSFVFTGINQPITFHGATVVQYIPPPYIAHDATAVSPPSPPPVPNNSSASLVNVVSPPVFPPQYYSIYPRENPAFVEDDTSLQSTDSGNERSPISRRNCEHFQHTNTHSALPPSYEEIFPELK